MITIEKGTNHFTTIPSGINVINADLFRLHQSYPNPVTSTCSIRYDLPEGSFVTLKVFDVQGREIETLVNGFQSEGSQSVQFNASNLPGGVYFYKINAGKYHDIKKLLVQK